MSAICLHFDARPRVQWIAAFLLVFAAWAGVAHAQAPLSPPYALFQYSTLTSSTNTITVTRVPVVTSTGTTYQNITLVFDVDSSGNVTLASGYPVVTPAPGINVSNFKAGEYVGPSNILGGKAMVNVSGPGVTSGGATEWSLSAASGAEECTYPPSATWYVGPLSSSPLAARLTAAGITSTSWSYGVTGEPNCSSSTFGDNALVGLSQVGNTITIVSFTLNTVDKAEPVDQITFTLMPK